MKKSTVLQKLIIDRLYPRVSQNDVARATTARLVSALEGVRALEAMTDNRDPRTSNDGHIFAVNQAAKKVSKKTEVMFPEIAALLGQERAALNAQIDKKANLTPTARAAEIRSVLRGMDGSDAIRAVRDAGVRGDAEVIAAVYGASELLTNVKESHLENIVNDYRHRTAPDEFEHLAMVDEVETSLEVIKGLFNRATAEAVDPAARRAAEEAAQAAGDANQAFEAALKDF